VNTGVELESIPKHCLLPTDVDQLTQVCCISSALDFKYLFIYYANNLSQQTRDLKSSTKSKNKLDTKTNKNEQCLVTGMECS